MTKSFTCTDSDVLAVDWVCVTRMACLR